MSRWRWDGNHGARERALAVFHISIKARRNQTERKEAYLISVYDIARKR